MDRPTGQVIRRYEHPQPGDMVHVDVKKLGRIPTGGGWRVHGRLGHDHTGVGYDYIHSAVDDHSRLAYSEICDDERAPTAAAFWTRATAFFAAHGIAVQRVLTDNAQVYRRSFAFRAAVLESGAVQRFTQPRHPQPTARWSASTAPCSRNGPTSDPTPQITSGPGLDGVAAHLQPSPRPYQPRSAPTHLTSQQRVWALQLEPDVRLVGDRASPLAGELTMTKGHVARGEGPLFYDRSTTFGTMSARAVCVAWVGDNHNHP